MRRIRFFLVWIGVLCGLSAWMLAAEAVQPQPLKAPAQVIGWIPAYGIEASMQALNSEPAIASGLTRIGLQFWNPTEDGRGVEFAPISNSSQRVTPAQVKTIVSWAKERHIQVVLTVYNNSQVKAKWDWAWARRAFAQHRSEFILALLKEMRSYELDGIDVDLEGEGHLEADRASYAHFIAALSKQVHRQHKILTVDSFHSPCMNAPNMLWWSDWRGKVDAIHSMGYQDLYEASTEKFVPEGRPVCEQGASIFKYSWQLAYGRRAGFQTSQIVLGMPTWLDSWGAANAATDTLAHLREVRDLGAGIALWDLQLTASSWRSAATWQAVEQLRTGQ